MYSLSVIEFIEKYKGRLLKKEEDIDKIKLVLEKESISQMTLFKFFKNKYYSSKYHEETLNRIKETTEENIKGVDKSMYYQFYLYYDEGFISYFENEKANKTRGDLGIKRPRNKVFTQ